MNSQDKYYDILIIGAGITGCMTAYKLARYDLRVAVVEAGSDVANGSTRSNSAIVHAGYDPEPGSLKAELNVKGCAEMPRLCEKLDVKYNACGSLVAAFAVQEIEILQELYERGVKNGVPGLEIINAEQLRVLEPNIADSAVAALWAPTAGIVCPFNLCIAAAEASAAAGCDYYFNFCVNKINKEDGIFRVSSADGRVLKAEYTVNAAGLYASMIAALAGETEFPACIIPRRGEYMLLDKSEGKTVNRPLFSVPTEKGKGILVTPTVDGNLMIGPNAYVIDDAGDTSTTAAGLAEVAAGAAKTVKRLNTRAVITSFSGVRATPSCGDFYIKPSVSVDGLLHLAGIESPGLASSPAVGDFAVDLLASMGVVLKKREGFTGKRPEIIRFHELGDDEKQKLIKKDPAYGKIICRCETVTEGEIIDAIRRPLGARTVDAVKRRTRAGTGRCQGGFCYGRVTAILSRELGVGMDKITKSGGESWVLTGGER